MRNATGLQAPIGPRQWGRLWAQIWTAAMVRLRLALIVAIGLGLGLSAPVRAEGPVLLTLSGAPDGVARSFDMAALQALPKGEFTTQTIWTEGPQHFEGVYLHELLAAAGIDAGTAVLTARNDYAIRIPVEELRPGEALLAYRRNGAEMSLRDKGPLWLVYPFDDSDAFQNEVIYSRSIWQIDRIAIEP